MVSFFILIWRADANTQTDNTLCDDTNMCCLSHKGPAGQFPAASPYSALRRPLYQGWILIRAEWALLLLHISSGSGPVHSLSFLRPLVSHVIGHSLLDGWCADLLGEPASMHAPGCQDHLGPADAATGCHVSSGI